MTGEDNINLVPISIRLETELVDDLKALARLRDVKYQSLARDVLHQWLTETKRDYLTFRENELENAEESM